MNLSSARFGLNLSISSCIVHSFAQSQSLPFALAGTNVKLLCMYSTPAFAPASALAGSLSIVVTIFL